MQSENLIQSLIDQTNQLLLHAQQLSEQPTERLTWKHDPESWSVLECLEHLNRYGDFYIPQIKNALGKNKLKPEADFKPGILGDYFAKSMLPTEKLNKMKTFKSKNPLNSNLDKSVIDTFIKQQLELIELLETSKIKNLSKIRIKTSISPLLKLKLGDTFRFFINHNIRHFAQIDRIQQSQNYGD